MSNKGLLIVYTGASGVGKGTIMKKLLLSGSNNKFSISVTTREPRSGEKDGREYHFISHNEFKSMIQTNSLLEYAQYCDNFYGTPRREVELMLSKGYNVFLEIEVQGGLQVKKNYPECISIFIMPPSIEELESRLRGRGTESESVIQKRLDRALTELNFAPTYDYTVINYDVDKSVRDIMRIINNERSAMNNLRI